VSATTEHVGVRWRIRADGIEEYDRRHARMWPELEERLRALGLRACTIFREGRDCFGHFELSGCSWEEHIEAYGADPLGQEWEQHFADLIEGDGEGPEAGLTRLVHVWSLGD